MFRVESKDDLELVAAMLDTYITDSFTSSCQTKTIQDKSTWSTNELNRLRKNTRRKQRVALGWSGPVHWESYHKAQRQYRQAVRWAKVNRWRSFYETINKVPEQTRLRKIFAKNREATKEPLGLPTRGLTKTPREALKDVMPGGPSPFVWFTEVAC